jgi:hypothetical protein
MKELRRGDGVDSRLRSLSLIFKGFHNFLDVFTVFTIFTIYGWDCGIGVVGIVRVVVCCGGLTWWGGGCIIKTLKIKFFENLKKEVSHEGKKDKAKRKKASVEFVAPLWNRGR